MIIGTTIGAGMLSLPLIVASCGFITAIVLLLMSWSVMYITAIKLLNVCAEYPLGANFTTMMESRSSKAYQIFFSIIYLLLLYALMSAYTTQGSSLIDAIGQAASDDKNLDINTALSAVIFILIFSSFMYSYKVSDYANRVFVFLKLVFFVLCIIWVIGYIRPSLLLSLPVSFIAIVFAWPTLLPSFGFHNIIPVLYEYQNGDIKTIRRSIFIGSISVLIIYIIWLFLCLAIIPQVGEHSYDIIFAKGNSLGDFIRQIKVLTNSPTIQMLLNVFVNVAIITSFLCVGISLMHYVRDIFARFDKKINDINISLVTFIPPLIFTVFYPKGFILALQYAAIFAVIIFVFTPIMLDRSKKLTSKNIYAITMGLLVIFAQIFNLSYMVNPFVH
jgi:amino acid permease